MTPASRHLKLLVMRPLPGGLTRRSAVDVRYTHRGLERRVWTLLGGSEMATETSQKTPAERLLDALGPVDRFHEDVGDFGSPARVTMEEYLEPYAYGDERTRMGPIEKVHLFWFAGMSCDGCTVAVTGAQAPTLESLMMGA